MVYNRKDFSERLANYCREIPCADCVFDGQYMDCGYIVMLLEAILKYVYKEDI